MTTERRLRAAIFANPEDDAPRLVYADWLLERGDPRGEFIQIQCRLGRAIGGSGKLHPNHPMAGPAPAERALELREQALLREHQKTWIAPIRGHVNSWFWQRGFVTRIDVSAKKLVAHAEALFDFTPLRGVYLMSCTPALVKRFGELPRVRSLRSLWLVMQRIGAREAESFHSPHFAQLRELTLQQNPLGDAAVEVLASSTTLHDLRELDLSFSAQELTTRGIESLANAAFFPQLTKLVLHLSLARKTAILPILERGTSLQTLSLGRHTITKQEAKLRAARGLDEPE
jgi:uncharacterized protein (TIGR02996 family)